MAETRACFCIVCLPVVLPVATRAEKIWANLILLGYRLQWAHRPSRDDDGAIEACSGVGRRGRGPEHVAARHAGLGRSLIQVLAFRPAHGLVAAQATPGGAMEVPWRCHGGAMAVPWRCRGGAMEGPRSRPTPAACPIDLFVSHHIEIFVPILLLRRHSVSATGGARQRLEHGETETGVASKGAPRDAKRTGGQLARAGGLELRR